MRMIITLTGAILLIQAVRMVLPLGSAGKYVSFVLGLFFMAVTLDTIGGLSFRGTEVLSGDLPQAESKQLEQVQQQQIFEQYANQLTEDIRHSIPSLSDARFTFDFSLEPFGTVRGLTIVSSREKQESAIVRLSELYGISQEVITWETK